MGQKWKGYVIGLGIALVAIFLRSIALQEKSVQLGLWSACVFVPILAYRLNKIRETWLWKATGICAALHVLLFISLQSYFPFRNMLPIAGIAILEAFIFILIYLRFDPAIEQ